MTAYLDLHVLQTVPPSNINRDDTGSPKTAVFGGVRRARVSSQAWKRAIRRDFENHLDPADLGVRSKRLVDLIARRIVELDGSLSEPAVDLATDALTTLGIKVEKSKRDKKDDADDNGGVAESGYLIFLGRRQIDNLAEAAAEAASSGSKLEKRRLGDLVKKDHSFDLALFGRMVAELSDLRVDASTQVAHAISVHAVENEFDYFTAVDDHAAGDHAGAGMIGTVEFNSSTLYRYATVNIDSLRDNLGDEDAIRRAVEAFVNSFVRSLPTGKQNTFANRTLPHAVVAILRVDQPINLAGAFETPVERDGSTSRLTRAAEALCRHASSVDLAYGSHGRNPTWVVTASDDVSSLAELGESVDLPTLVTRVGEAVQRSLVAP